MRQGLFTLILAVLFVGFGEALPRAQAAEQCSQIFPSPLSKSSSASIARNRFHDPRNRALALEIMMQGSLNVSRTKVFAKRFMAPSETRRSQIPQIAEINFKIAAEYILNHFDALEMNLSTAIALNRILTHNLVPEEHRGRHNFRNAVKQEDIDDFIGLSPNDFYIFWLESPESLAMQKENPIKFAEIVHNTIISLDSFPDGNGRLSRLFADLALIKANLAPAYYTSMNEYFARGTPLAPVHREARQEYFYEIVRRGVSYMVYNSPATETSTAKPVSK